MQVYNIQRSHDLKELTFHGSTTFPVAVYTTVMNDNILGYIPLHWHEELQFMVVIEGAIRIRVNQKQLILSAGEGLFINANLLHTSSSHECENSKFICFDIDKSFFSLNGFLTEKYMDLLLDDEHLPYFKFSPAIDWQNDLITLLNGMYKEHSKKEYGYELLFMSSLLKVSYLMVSNISSDRIVPRLSGNEHKRIKTLITYIHSHYNEKVTLDDIALSANISRSECCRFFKKMTQLTPIEYLTNYRINQSIYLLKNSDHTITEIASEVGFSSSSYFINKFKQHTAYTPKEFQRIFKI